MNGGNESKECEVLACFDDDDDDDDNDDDDIDLKENWFFIWIVGMYWLYLRER